MGSYGSKTPKGTKLVGTHPCLQQAGRKMTHDQKVRQKEGYGATKVTKQYVAQDGKKRFTAGPDMKATQEYPCGIGSEMGLSMSQFLPSAINVIQTEFEITESVASSGNADDVGCLCDFE